MFVADWMTKNVFTVREDDSVAHAAGIIKEKKIKHLPVLSGDKLVGILSDRDIKEYIPSKASSLDAYELHYLIAKTNVKEIMKTHVVTTDPKTPVETAAMKMFDHNIGCLPVVEKDKLIGIISDKDIFRVMVEITGVRRGGNRISLSVDDKPGSIKEVADIVRKHGFSLQSILSTVDSSTGKDVRNIVIRTRDKGDIVALEKEINSVYKNVNIING